MPVSKRQPSSSVHTVASKGAMVSMPRSSRVRRTSSAASTPNTPSKRPPKGWVSRWLPASTGGASASVPGRRAKILPMASIRGAKPASRHQETKRSRAFLSRAVKAKRLEPPPGVAPISAISIRLCQSLSPLTRTSAALLTPPPRPTRNANGHIPATGRRRHGSQSPGCRWA